MDREIKRLLSLRANPHFQLSPAEMEKIEEWEKAQKHVKIEKVEKMEAPEGFEVSDGIGTDAGPAIMPKVKKPRKKTKNIVKKEEKEVGDIEES